MPKRLTQSQQRAILDALPESHKQVVGNYCRACSQHGDGITEILKKIKDFLGPIVKDVGPKVLKEFVLPLLLKKAKEHYGVGLSPAGGSIKLAGQGGKKRAASAGKKVSPWVAHCKKVAAEQGLSYKEAMKVASKTYRR